MDSLHPKVLNGPAPVKLFRLIRISDSGILNPRAHHIMQFQFRICEYLLQIELLSY